MLSRYHALLSSLDQAEVKKTYKKYLTIKIYAHL